MGAKKKKRTDESRSGTTLSYDQRKDNDRQPATFTLAKLTKELIGAMATKLGKTRSAVVDEAIAEFAKKHR